ncbi:phage baseplate assembly protein domain-containing protein [Desulfarculus baarsii]
MVETIKRLMEPLRNRVLQMTARALVRLIEYDEQGRRTLQCGLYADENAAKIEQMQEFGFASEPPEDAEAFVIFMDGNRAHGVAVATDAPHLRPLGLAPGEVVIFSSADALAEGEEGPPAAPEGVAEEFMRFWPEGWPEEPPEDWPEGWPAWRRPLCRIGLKPDRTIQVTAGAVEVRGASIHLAAVGDLTVAAGDKLTLAAGSEVLIAAPTAKLWQFPRYAPTNWWP